MQCQVSASRGKVVIPLFSYINLVPSLSMCPSFRLSMTFLVIVSSPNMTFLVIVSSPKPLDIATLNLVDA